MRDEALFDALVAVFGDDVHHAIARVGHEYLQHQDAGLQRRQACTTDMHEGVGLGMPHV